MDLALKKILKRIFLVLFCFILFLFLGVYLVLRYRIKYVLNQVVKIETHGAYNLDFSSLSFSVLKGDVKIKNASFNCIEPIAGKTSYHVKIPDFYFSLESWRPLLFHKKLVIDSIYIASPEVKVLEAESQKNDHKTGLELYNVYNILKQATNELEVQTVKIKEAIIDFYSTANDYSFKINHVDFLLNNFTRRKHSASHFLLSDDIDLSIKKQQWVLPNGNIFGFSNLHFSSGDQYFEIDSGFLKTDDEQGQNTNITASKFFFSSSHLPSVYLENKLLIDTLSCISPIIEIETNGKIQNADTTALLTKAFTRFFSQTYFKYISVVDGQLSLMKKENGAVTNYQSQKANLRLYDLDIHSGDSQSFSLGDIEFELDKLEFFSPDSLYRLRMTKLSIENGNLVCKNSSFGPVLKTNGSGMHLTLPKIVLNNIDVEELLEKKLKAKYAQFENPEIFISKIDLSRNKRSKTARVYALYTALHSLRDLIDVEAVYVKHGDLYVTQPSNVTVTGSNMNAIIRLNDLFKSDSLVDIKTSLSELNFGRLQLNTPRVKLILENSNAKGPVHENKIKNASAYLNNGMEIHANDIFWSKLDWDILYNKRIINVDEVKIQKLNVRYKETREKRENDKGSRRFFHANTFSINDLEVNAALLNGTNIYTKGNHMIATNLTNGDHGLQWSDIKAKFKNSAYSKAATKITVDVSEFDKQHGSILKNVNVSTYKNQFVIPEVKLGTTINSTKLSNLHLQYLVLNDPKISLASGDIETGERKLMMPFNIKVDKTEINKAAFKYSSGREDPLQVTGIADIMIDSMHMFKHADSFLNYQFCEMRLTNTEMTNKKMTANISRANLTFENSMFRRNEENKLVFSGDSKLQWTDIGCKLRDSSKFVMRASNLSGEIVYPSLSIQTGIRFDPINIVDKLKISNGSLFYSDTAKTISANELMLDGAKNDLELKKIAIVPNISKDSFFKTSEWQKDYVQINCGKLNVHNVDLQKLLKDTVVSIEEVTFEDASLITSRNKTIPFQHGVEKLMPTKLIQTINRPFYLRRLTIKNASITSNEIASSTNREGSVPFISLNGEIRNINNNPLQGDSLVVSANAVFLDHYVRSFRYKESYSDSLSGFHMVIRMSPMDLTALTVITNPLAAVDVARGNSDTLFERIAGNKYAALGEMKFYYRGLKIRILDPIDTTKKNLALSFKNLVANKFVLRSNNKKISRVFFIRDTEKFIFNYWFKTTFSGVMTSAGMKNSKKYLKLYREVKDDYLLPSRDDW